MSVAKPNTKVYADFSSLTSKGKHGKSLRDPHGFDLSIASGNIASTSTTQGRNDEADQALRAKKAWEVAMSPGKTIPMQAFMAWMSGTSVSIFSILITGMILMTPVKTIMSVQQTFAPLERAGKSSGSKLDLTMQKAAFVAINIAGLLFGIYRLSIMGLLPTTTSDWLAFIPAKRYIEFSG
ncbi:hypothetical protein BX070DRAFT_229322 [Coemansia spiralis]|nr:hypothetical protein BX070DRAFT_229322 [Coemansia spiralis]